MFHELRCGAVVMWQLDSRARVPTMAEEKCEKAFFFRGKKKDPLGWRFCCVWVLTMGRFSFSFNVPAISWVSLLWKSLVNAIFYWFISKEYLFRSALNLKIFEKNIEFLFENLNCFSLFSRTFFRQKMFVFSFVP